MKGPLFSSPLSGVYVEDDGEKRYLCRSPIDAARLRQSLDYKSELASISAAKMKLEDEYKDPLCGLTLSLLRDGKVQKLLLLLNARIAGFEK